MMQVAAWAAVGAQKGEAKLRPHMVGGGQPCTPGRTLLHPRRERLFTA